jgi:hypothetical protein
MIARALQIAVVVNYLLASVLAIYPPVSPLQGSYTWEIVISSSSGPVTYTGGRTLYDYVSGYVRMESWNDTNPNPGINGVTIWDLREQQPIVSTIDSNAQCVVEKLDSNVTAPMPMDWSGFQFNQLTYFNRALAEEWTDGFGGLVYVDVFDRDIVGMGNTSTGDDGESIFYNIMEWTDQKPDGTEFLLPNTVLCKPVQTLAGFAKAPKFAPHSAMFSLKCTACKIGIGVVIGRLCSIGGAAACAVFPPSIPFCSVLAGLACKRGASLGKDKACKVIHMC